MSKLVCAACALSLAMLAPVARAAADADLTEIRKQIQSLKDDYEARIRALEDKLKDAEAKAPAPAPLQSSGGANTGLAAFNPAISLVLQGRYANLSQDPNTFAIAGFPLGGEAGPGRRGFSLSETEMTLSANADDRFAGQATISITPDNQVSVEEAFATYTAAPYGLAPKFGRFFSGIGYLNEQHQHVWDFKDAPLAYQAFLAGQYTQDGGQVKWVAPTDTFLEFGAEIGNGDSFPGSSRNSNSLGAASVFAHAGDDIGANANWRAGLSYLETHAADRQATLPDTAGNLAQVSFAGTSHVAIADFVWKYAPTGNSTDTNVKVQGEYFWRRESGTLTYDSNGALGLTQAGAYSSTQSGWYLQGIWQFMPRWRVGLRYDSLDPGDPDYGINNAILATPPSHPNKATVMFDYTPSEFSRFRIQYAQSKTRPEMTDNQFFLQYILTLGAHPAHKF